MTKTAAPPAPSPYLSTGRIAQLYGVHRDTVWDWIKTGVRAIGGAQVKLRALRVGGHWKSTQEWIKAFLDACQGGEGLEIQPSQRCLDTEARKDQERLARKLERK